MMISLRVISGARAPLASVALRTLRVRRRFSKSGAMGSRTALNEPYKGLVVARAVPAELHRRADGRVYASFGSARPIHCCTPEEVARLARTTHHYCDIFTEQLMAPLGELAYVRLDDTTAEKVFINRSKRLLLTSADGALAQWRAAPTFESLNRFAAGTPVVNEDGALVTLLTARRGNHYAVSTFEGDGGYFDTPLPWTTLPPPAAGASVYGDRTFASRDELRAYVASLPPGAVSAGAPARPVLHCAARGAAGAGGAPRVALVAAGGRQLAHCYLHNVLSTDIEYL